MISDTAYFICMGMFMVIIAVGLWAIYYVAGPIVGMLFTLPTIYAIFKALEDL